MVVSIISYSIIFFVSGITLAPLKISSFIKESYSRYHPLKNPQIPHFEGWIEIENEKCSTYASNTSSSQILIDNFLLL